MKYIFTLFSVLYTLAAFSQGIQGKITTTTGTAIPSATITVLNSTKATASDQQGNFAITLSNGSYQLSFSAIGFATQFKTVSIKNVETIIQINLQADDKQLNEVLVNAEKKEQDVQRVPAAITVLGAKQIRDYRLWDITNLTAISPSLFTVEHGNSTSSNFFNIRGVMGFSNEQAVATYVDGVYQFDYFSAPPLFNDIQSIEILRGPQGTLYGRNAFGGVVNIITKQPGNKPGGYFETTYGNYGQQRYTASLTGPILKDKLFASSSFTYNHRGSIYYNAYTKSGFDRREDYSGNFNLRYLPSANWSLALNAKLENDNDRGSFPWVGSYDEVLAKPFQVNTNNSNVERRNNFNTSLAANYYGNDFTFTSVSSYIDWHVWYEGRGVDYDFSPLDALSTAPDQRQHVFSQELRFASPPASQNRLKWVAGAYGFTQRTRMNAPVFFGPDYILLDPAATNVPFTTTNVSRGTNRGYAFFGQVTYGITGKLDFTAGIRYDHETRKLGPHTDYQKDPDPVTQLMPSQDYKANFNAVTPKFVLSYKLQDNMLLYGSYARGFRAGGLNTNASDPKQVPYQPEHSDNYEIGWKNMLWNNRLKFNLTAFYLEQHNQQISTAMDGINALILNVGEMHNKGIELEVTALPVKGLQFDWNASFSHARYISLLLYDATAGAVANFKGNRPINTPPVSSMLAAQYTYDFTGSKQKLAAFVRGEYRYLGKYYFDFVNGLSQPAYSLFNAKSGISTRNYELNFWARNITDKNYVAYGSFGAFLLGSPRTYGTTLIARF
jgi:iron complex outermembrane receptor protein